MKRLGLLFSGRLFIAAFWLPVLRFYAWHQIIKAVEGLHGLRLGRGYGVGVDVGCGGGLGVAQLLRHDHQRSTIRNHQIFE